MFLELWGPLHSGAPRRFLPCLPYCYATAGGVQIVCLPQHSVRDNIHLELSMSDDLNVATPPSGPEPLFQHGQLAGKTSVCYV